MQFSVQVLPQSLAGTSSTLCSIRIFLQTMLKNNYRNRCTSLDALLSACALLDHPITWAMQLLGTIVSREKRKQQLKKAHILRNNNMVSRSRGPS